MRFDKKNLISIITAFVIAVILVIGLDFNPIGSVTPDQKDVKDKPAAATTTATVTRVVDGDTIDVQIDSSSDTVRLIGVDAPEIQWPSSENSLDEPQEEECFAFASQEWLQQKVKDRQVRLVKDSLQPARDTYDRRLAYVYVDDQLINRKLLSQGYAQQMIVGDGFDKQVSFQGAETAAREQNRGLWGDCE